MKSRRSREHLYRLTAYDGLLIGAILILSLSWLPDFGGGPLQGGRFAIVYENGRAIEKVDLGPVQTVRLSIESGSMEIEAGEGQIRVSNSSCPHKTCVGAGWVRGAGLPIICVPNKVLIEIHGNSDRTYDAVTY